MQMNFVLVDFENVQPKNMGALRGGQFRVKVFVGANQTRFPREMVLAMHAFGPSAEYIEIEGSGVNALDFHIAFYMGRLAALHPDAVFHVISRDRGFDPLIRHLGTLGISCRRFASLAEIPGVTAVTTAEPARVPARGRAATPVATVPSSPRAPAPPAARNRVPPPVSAAPATRAVPVVKQARLPAPRTVAAKPAAAALPARPDRVAQVEAHLQRARAARPATQKKLESSIRNWLDKEMAQAEMDRIVAQLVRRGKVAIAGGKVSYPGAA